jgi:hypothetical protein
MMLVVQRWNKIAKDLQACVHTQIPKNKKICKHKWNELHSNY